MIVIILFLFQVLPANSFAHFENEETDAWQAGSVIGLSNFIRAVSKKSDLKQAHKMCLHKNAAEKWWFRLVYSLCYCTIF